MRAAPLIPLLLLAACEGQGPGSTLAELADGARYLDDPAFRRAAMERSLTNHDNLYSRQRLASYGLITRGWDRLPEWRPLSRVLDGEDAAAVEARGLPALTERPAPPAIWDGRRPKSLDEWIALGREVFLRYPLRPEPLLEFAVQRPELASAVGLQRLPDGSYPGLQIMTDIDGRRRVGMSCALCHSSVEAGQLVIGRARRDFDYGRLRVTYHAETGAPVDADLLRRMKTWGPGRADVTADDEDPVAIPDLWGLAAESALTHAGTIQQGSSPVPLALRQETQLLDSNHQRVRPPRELALALAFFLRSFEPPPRERVHSAEATAGAKLFARSCVSCHDNAAYGGEPVAASLVGTDPALANGNARGTGRYRPSALLDVRKAGPYLHHGAVSTLEELFSPARLRDDYARSPLGPGAVPGHAFGTELGEADRRALIAFLDLL